MFANVWHQLTRKSAKRSRRRRPDPKPALRYRLRIERLEDRTLLDGTPITPPQRQAILDGLSALSSWGGRMNTFGPLAQPVTLVNQTISRALPLDQTLDSRLYQPVSQYLAAPGATLEGLVGVLNGLGYSASGDIGATELRVGLTLNAQSATSSSFDLGSRATALGISLPSPPALSINASLHFRFAFGVGLASNNFFLRPDTTDQATVGLSVHASGLNLDVAFATPPVTLQIVNGSLNLDASAAATFQNPHGDGTFTVADLQSAPLASLVNVTASGSLTGSLPLSAAVPGFEPFGSSTIVVSADNVFNLQAGPDVSLSVPFADNLLQPIRSVVARVSDVAFDGFVPAYRTRVNTTLPVLNQTIEQVLYAIGATRIEDFLNCTQAVTDYFQGGGPLTADGLVGALVNRLRNLAGTTTTGLLARGPISIVGGLDPAQRRLRFDVTMDGQRSRDQNITLNVGDEAHTVHGVAFKGSATATAHVDVGLRLAYSFGIDLDRFLAGQPVQASDIFLQVNNLRLEGTLRASGINARLTAGFLEGDITGGSITLNPTFDLVFANRGRVTLGDLTGPSSITERTNLLAYGPFGVILPVQASFGDYVFPQTARVTVNTSDLFSAPPAFQLQNFDDNMLNFVNLSPQEVVTRLQQLGAWFSHLGTSSVLTRKLIPFTSRNLGHVLDLGGAFIAQLPNQLVRPGTLIPSFETAQELTTELGRILAIPPEQLLEQLRPHYDPTNKVLSYHIRFTHTAQTTLPLGFSFQITPLVVVSGSSQINANGTVIVDFVFGFRLVPEQVPQLVGFLDGVPPTNGQLRADAHFTVKVGTDAPVNVTVTQASTAGNHSLDDLANSITAAIRATRLGDTVVAQVAGNAIRLATQGAAAALSLTVSAALADPAVTQLGFPADGRLSRNSQFTLRIGTGSPVTVRVPSNANNMNMDDLVSNFNTALQSTSLGSQIVATHSGSRLILSAHDLTVGTLLKLNLAADDPMATDLGFQDGQVARAQLGEIFIKDLSIAGPPGQGMVQVSVNDIQTAARFGLLAIRVGHGNISGGVNLTFNVNDRVALTDLFKWLVNPNQFPQGLFVSTYTGQVDLNLTDLTVDFDFLGTLTGNPSIRLTVPNAGDPSSVIVTPNRDFDPLNRFQRLRLDCPLSLSPAELETCRKEAIIPALERFVSAFSRYDVFGRLGSRFLTTALPGINVSVSELVDYARRFTTVINNLRTNPAVTVQTLAQQVLQALGYDSRSNIQIAMDGNALKIALSFYTPELRLLRTMNLDVQALARLRTGGVPSELQDVERLVHVSGLGQIEILANARLDLKLGIDLEGDPVPFVYDDTRASLNLLVNASNLNFKAAVGPLGIYIRNGRLVLDRDGGGTTPLQFSVSLVPPQSGHRYFFPDDTRHAPRLFDGDTTRVDLTGRFDVTLPLYLAVFDSDPTFLGNLRITVSNLSNILTSPPVSGSVAIQTPDIARFLRKIGDLVHMLQDPAVFLKGFDTILGVLQSGFDSEFLSHAFPVIGRRLRDAAQVIQSFRANVLGGLESVVRLGGKHDVIFGRIVARLRQEFDALHLRPTVTGTQDSRTFRFYVDIQSDLREITLPGGINFDIGLPALGLAVSGGVTLKVGWHFAFAFGVQLPDQMGRDGGFFFELLTGHALSVQLEVSTPNLRADGRLGFLKVRATDAGTRFTGNFDVDVRGPTSSRHPTFVTFGDIIAGQVSIKPYLTMRALVNLGLEVSFGDIAGFPKFKSDFTLDWRFSPTDPNLNGQRPTIAFNNIRLNLGTFISNFVSPILDKVNTAIRPVRPVVDALTMRLPVISDLAGEDITLLRLAAIRMGVDYNQRFAPFVDAYRTVTRLIDLLNQLPRVDEGLEIPIGNFNLNHLDLRLPLDLSSKDPQIPAGQPDIEAQIGQLTNPQIRTFTQELNLRPQIGLEFPFLKSSKRDLVFRLFMGQNFDIFTFKMRALEASFEYRQSFPVFWPVSVTLSGRLETSMQVSFGYDTQGLRDFVTQGQHPRDLLNGFYVNTTETYVRLSGSIGAGVSVGVHVFGVGVEVGIEGDITATVTGRLHNPSGEDKLHYPLLVYALSHDPSSLFEISGNISAGLRVWADLDLILIHWHPRWNVGRVNLIRWGRDGANGADVQPIIVATDRGNGELQLNMGPHAAERLYGDTRDSDESFRVQHISGAAGDEAVDVIYLSPNGPITQRYEHISKIVAWGGRGNDTVDLRGVLADSELHGGLQNNTFYASDGTSLLEGGPAEDDLYGGAGTTTFHGGRGHHRLHAGTGAATVVETADTNFTLSDTQLLMEGYGTDELDGVRGAVLTGGSSPTTFIVSGWTGTATLTGGGTTNTVVSTNDTDFILSDTSLIRSDGASFTLSNIQRAVLTGGPGDNRFTVSNWSGSALLDGGDGNDTYTVTFRGQGEGTVTINSSGTTGRSSLAVDGVPADVVETDRDNGQVRLYEETVNYARINRLIVNGQVIFDDGGSFAPETNPGLAVNSAVSKQADLAAWMLPATDTRSERRNKEVPVSSGSVLLTVRRDAQPPQLTLIPVARADASKVLDGDVVHRAGTTEEIFSTESADDADLGIQQMAASHAELPALPIPIPALPVRAERALEGPYTGLAAPYTSVTPSPAVVLGTRVSDKKTWLDRLFSEGDVFEGQYPVQG